MSDKKCDLCDHEYHGNATCKAWRKNLVDCQCDGTNAPAVQNIPIREKVYRQYARTDYAEFERKVRLDYGVDHSAKCIAVNGYFDRLTTERIDFDHLIKRVVVNGCFDLLHPGHVRLLEFASLLGSLTVLVNSDASIRKLKGDDRPIIDEAGRVAMLQALRCVDEVIVFDDPDPSRALARMYEEGCGPHIVIKGDEYSSADMPEREVVTSNGGQFLFKTRDQFYKKSPTTYSTTGIIERIRRGS